MRIRQWLVMAVLAAVALVPAVPAYAATVYVDAANASGVEDGTPQAPYDTIQEAINAAAEGDTVSVAPGIYFGAIEMKSNVPVMSQKGPKSTIIDGMGASPVVNSPFSLTAASAIDGFTIRNGVILISATNRVSFWAGSTWAINNCILQEALIGISNMPGATVRIMRTLFTNISLRAIDAIWCPAPQFMNVTINNVETAFFIYQIGLGVNNTTVTNVRNFVSLWGSYGSGYVSGSNNNVWNYTAFTVPNDRGYYPTMALQNTLEADPLFVNAPLDYALRPGSPLIDAGINLGLPFFGVAPDIGAYEYAPQSVPELVEALAESYARVPAEAFKNAGEQRLNALHNKFMAILHMLDSLKNETTAQGRKGVLSAALNKLGNDVWAKGDGFYGGNPNDDWITTKDEQDALYPRVMEVKQAIESELAQL